MAANPNQAAPGEIIIDGGYHAPANLFHDKDQIGGVPGQTFGTAAPQQQATAGTLGAFQTEGGYQVPAGIFHDGSQVTGVPAGQGGLVPPSIAPANLNASLGAGPAQAAQTFSLGAQPQLTAQMPAMTFDFNSAGTMPDLGAMSGNSSFNSGMNSSGAASPAVALKTRSATAASKQKKAGCC